MKDEGNSEKKKKTSREVKNENESDQPSPTVERCET